MFTKLSKWNQYFKEKLFGTIKSGKLEVPKKIVVSQKEKTVPLEITEAQDSPAKRRIIKQKKQRDPYIVQIGFDFGTSYSKCICRDINLDKAWVYLPKYLSEFELPFLLPCALTIKNQKLKLIRNSQEQYPSSGLYHLKMALVSVALKDWHNPLFDPYKKILNSSNSDKLKTFIENCAIFYLGSMFGEVRNEIRNRFKGTHHDDYTAVNLAIPVADAQKPQVNDTYIKVLNHAWNLSDQLYKIPWIGLNDVLDIHKLVSTNYDTISEQCCIYPEVSANVQGFVRSRVSKPGVYLFSDTGAGTVDQSVFIFHKTNKIEELSYLEAQVCPIGSCKIELIAAENSGKIDSRSIENWCERKESGENCHELNIAKTEIFEQLSNYTGKTLAGAKKKLMVKTQLNDINIIFGGGGHCEYPYQKGAMVPFSSNLFSGRGINPDIIGLPAPKDLDLKDSEKKWMKRLYVAYGLSFLKDDLVKFLYPNELETPTTLHLWQPRRKNISYVSQDMC